MNTGIYAGLCGVLLVLLYLRISQRRLVTKIGLGSGGDADLERRIRAHGNFIESVPMALLLLFLFEHAGADPIYIHTFGILLVISRVCHNGDVNLTCLWVIEDGRPRHRPVLWRNRHGASDRRAFDCVTG
ncbi:MAG: MAPEG family protein [Hylemonella sp.]